MENFYDKTLTTTVLIKRKPMLPIFLYRRDFLRPIARKFGLRLLGLGVVAPSRFRLPLFLLSISRRLDNLASFRSVASFFISLRARLLPLFDGRDATALSPSLLW